MNIERTPTARRLVELSLRPAPSSGSPPLPSAAESHSVAVDPGEHTLTDTMPDAVIVALESGAICQVNRRAEIVFGRSREELLGYELPLLFSDVDRPGLASMGGST